MKASTAERNRRSLKRAAEALATGVEVRYIPETGAFLVPSRTVPNQWHEVHLKVAGHEHLTVSCGCTQGRRSENFEIAGLAGCWHAAAACSEAAVRDAVFFDGEIWQLTATARSVVAA